MECLADFCCFGGSLVLLGAVHELFQMRKAFAAFGFCTMFAEHACHAIARFRERSAHAFFRQRVANTNIHKKPSSEWPFTNHDSILKVRMIVNNVIVALNYY